VKVGSRTLRLRRGRVCKRTTNVLFLCAGNSARSIMGEAILNGKGRPLFTAFSAGSHPSGIVRPEALKLISLVRLPMEGLRSKNWEEFAKPGAPKMNFRFSPVLRQTPPKKCVPFGPGQPMTAHWGVPDPAEVKGTPEQIERAFFVTPTCFSNDGSACSSACLFPAWTNLQYKKRSIKSALVNPNCVSYFAPRGV